ncbi:MAG: helix-turn-helix domain-containing protein [Bacillota bacterium]
MENANSQLLSLPALAQVLNLPEAWIKTEADADRIPHLKIGKRYRFNREAVLAVLSQRAARGDKGVAR